MMNNSDKYNLLRFVEAQEAYGIYDIAVSELERGREAEPLDMVCVSSDEGTGV